MLHITEDSPVKVYLNTNVYSVAAVNPVNESETTDDGLVYDLTKGLNVPPEIDNEYIIFSVTGGLNDQLIELIPGTKVTHVHAFTLVAVVTVVYLVQVIWLFVTTVVKSNVKSRLALIDVLAKLI